MFNFMKKGVGVGTSERDRDKTDRDKDRRKKEKKQRKDVSKTSLTGSMSSEELLRLDEVSESDRQTMPLNRLLIGAVALAG